MNGKHVYKAMKLNAKFSFVFRCTASVSNLAGSEVPQFDSSWRTQNFFTRRITVLCIQIFEQNEKKSQFYYSPSRFPYFDKMHFSKYACDHLNLILSYHSTSGGGFPWPSQQNVTL